MTELEQIETDTRFASLKKILDRSKNLADMERKLGGPLSIKQARLFSRVFQKRDEEKALDIQTRLKLAPQTAAEIRYSKMHPSHKIGKTKTGRVYIRNSMGKFAKVPKYIKEAIHTVKNQND